MARLGPPFWPKGFEPRETTKMTKMAGVPRARAWFTQSTVSWTPSFREKPHIHKNTLFSRAHSRIGLCFVWFGLVCQTDSRNQSNPTQGRVRKQVHEPHLNPLACEGFLSLSAVTRSDPLVCVREPLLKVISFSSKILATSSRSLPTSYPLKVAIPLP